MSGENIYKLTPLEVGICTLGERHLLGDEYSDDNRVIFALYSFLFESDKLKGLVDMGPETLEYTNDMFNRYGFFRDTDGEVERPDDIVQKNGNVFAWLERLNVTPEEIKAIIMTHVHADHHGMDDAKNPGAGVKFPKAIFYSSKIGWEQNLKKKVGDQWNSYLDHQFANFLLEKQKEGKVIFTDNEEILPGIEVKYLGGHAICSQMISIPTQYGLAVITSDEIYKFEFLRDGILPRLHTSPQNIIDAWELLVSTAEKNNGILIPVHEPYLAEVYEKYGDAWLAEVKKVSDEAIASYRSRTPKVIGT